MAKPTALVSITGTRLIDPKCSVTRSPSEAEDREREQGARRRRSCSRGGDAAHAASLVVLARLPGRNAAMVGVTYGAPRAVGGRSAARLARVGITSIGSTVESDALLVGDDVVAVIACY